MLTNLSVSSKKKEKHIYVVSYKPWFCGIYFRILQQIRTLYDGNLRHIANGNSDSNWLRRVDSAF